MRTFVYVDGFNLYYGVLRGTAWKWLDLPSGPPGLLLPGFQTTGSPRMPAGYHYR